MLKMHENGKLKAWRKKGGRILGRLQAKDPGVLKIVQAVSQEIQINERYPVISTFGNCLAARSKET